ncbi:hypothetical protein Moror_12123 [Moniliophthora roreri MCA 2997]|uniref:Uncharacterized protein n=1 Tax=Moniliophthora roreri (strain MCA 2997) TaxID=1381753 RepID=V2XPA9_MONRO|nr:hypothetical protein Moror_12123 [Moniliophthora roreri MCA 2997]
MLKEHLVCSVYGYVVDSDKVRAALGSTSLTPVQNAFLDAFLQYGFQIYEMLTIDPLYELELGVWKAILIYEIHCIYAHKDKADAVTTLDDQF